MYELEPRKSASPWKWVLLGCGLALVLGIGIVAALGYGTYRWGKSVEASMKDPATREAEVRRVLGCAELPKGYYAVAAISIPFIMDMAVLSDQPPKPGGHPGTMGERGLIFMRILTLGKQKQDVEDYFEGRSQDAEPLRRSGIHIDSSEVLKRGVLEAKGANPRLRFLVQRGSLSQSGRRSQGLITIVLPACPSKDKQTMVIWAGPDPSSGGALDPAQLSGTVADEGAIAEMMGLFKLCE
ncbi:MAG: hypothetical protein IPQ13_14240 [Holophagaceae bacterium]|nr:hypothetical protein [Holophagaceae bacterium]